MKDYIIIALLVLSILSIVAVFPLAELGFGAWATGCVWVFSAAMMLAVIVGFIPERED